MLKTILVLPDGTEISSGAGAEQAIQSCTYTECVNAGTELTLGSVCAAMVELKLITPQGGLSVAAGDELTVYKDDGTARHQLGIFIAEKPQRPTVHTMHITAYDRVSLLDKDVAGWLGSLTGWPYSLQALAQQVCSHCGLELQSTQIPNGSLLVQKFSAGSITGRTLIQWIAQAAGRFCRATAEGKLEFAWYDAPLQLSYDSGSLTLQAQQAVRSDTTLSLYVPDMQVTEDGGTVTLKAAGLHQLQARDYFAGSFSCADYTVAPVEKVQIQQNSEDVGVVYPDDDSALNTYRITGNLLLSGAKKEELHNMAQTLLAQLEKVSYTPGKLTVPASLGIRAGNVVTVTDPAGREVKLYVMQRKQTGQTDTLECTGSHRRDSVSAVNEQTYQALSGKVLNLRTEVDGLKAENKAADGRLAALALDVDGISTQVEKQSADTEFLRTELTAVQQTANAVKITVRQMQDQGAAKVITGMGYTFDDTGLKIARQGAQMENLLDNTGMYVTRGGDAVLQANSDGVEAVDIKVRNYLNVGASRLESYEGNRTACFYVGG